MWKSTIENILARLAGGCYLVVSSSDGEHPIAYASRTLTKAKCSYSQIEKEALALVFGVRCFYKYLYGRKFTLITDHKPLLCILGPNYKVPLIAAARMQQ